MATPFVAVRVLWPPSPLGIFEGEERNDLAVVLHVEVHGVRLLLTGDVGGESEAELVKMSEAGMLSLASEVLKVAHHGSDTSSSEAFLGRVWSAVAEGERFAVIQSGREHFSGTTLPTGEVVERLHAWTGAGHLLSTQHDDEEKSSSEAAGDDHVVLRINPGGSIRLCYNPGLGVPERVALLDHVHPLGADRLAGRDDVGTPAVIVVAGVGLVRSEEQQRRQSQERDEDLGAEHHRAPHEPLICARNRRATSALRVLG